MTTNYTGNIDFSGSITDSVGNSATISGSLGVTLSTTLNNNGTGTGTEAITGSLAVQYTYANGSTGSNTIPFDVTTPSLPFQLGDFQVSDKLPSSLLGLSGDLTVSGTVSATQSVISENLTEIFSGTYQGVTFSGRVSGSGALQFTPFRPTPSLITLANFNHTSISAPKAGLIIDAAGDLFGTASGEPPYGDDGSATSDGMVFEIVRTNGSYSGTPTTLVSFTGTDGAHPTGSLITDAAGDLFGTTAGGGKYGPGTAGGTAGDGTVFEIAKSAEGYASAPITLVNFDGANGADPAGNLISDANGDLFGIAEGGGVYGYGTLFEIVKAGGSYSSTPTVLISWDRPGIAEYLEPYLITDADRNLFGSTYDTGQVPGYNGTVFELAKTSTGYASSPTTLIDFTAASLIVNGAGDLFGTTNDTVFELAKTAKGYATTPTTLATFNNTDGSGLSGLIMDGAGNLFGIASSGGADDWGTVFEILHANGGYTSTPITLATFNNVSNGGDPNGGLIANGAGDLFGTTYQGGEAGDSYGAGTVFEITGSGFVPFQSNLTGDGVSDLLMTNSDTGAVLLDQVSDGAMTYQQIGGLGAEWQFEGTGTFLGQATDDFLLWDGTSGGIVVAQDVGGTAQYTQVGGVGPEWQFEGNGPFLGQATSDFLLWNSGSGAIVVGAVANGAAQYSVIGDVGSEWKFEGTGDYLGDGNAGFLLWNSNTGGLFVGEDVSGAAQYTQIGGLGSEWVFEGTGDLLGRAGQDDFLVRDQNNGALFVGEVTGDTAQYTQIGALGPEWQFLGVGNYDGASQAEFALRDSTNGSLYIGSVSGDSVTYTPIGAVGPEWNFHTTNVATVA